MILLLFSFLFFLSCNNKDQNAGTAENLLDKTISFPENLLLYKDGHFYPSALLESEIKDKSIIISIIDATCTECFFNQLNQIDSIFASNNINDDVRLFFILNCMSEDSLYFVQNLKSAIEVSGTILWDRNFDFERQNDIFTSDINKRTFLISKNGKVIQFGNPVFNPDVLNEYKRKLRLITEDTSLYHPY